MKHTNCTKLFQLISGAYEQTHHPSGDVLIYTTIQFHYNHFCTQLFFGFNQKVLKPTGPIALSALLISQTALLQQCTTLEFIFPT